MNESRNKDIFNKTPSQRIEMYPYSTSTLNFRSRFFSTIIFSIYNFFLIWICLFIHFKEQLLIIQPNLDKMMLDNLITRETNTTTGLCINCSVYTHKNVVYYYKTSIFVNNVCQRIKIILIRKVSWSRNGLYFVIITKTNKKNPQNKMASLRIHNSGYMTSEFTFFPKKNYI